MTRLALGRQRRRAERGYLRGMGPRLVVIFGPCAPSPTLALGSPDEWADVDGPTPMSSNLLRRRIGATLGTEKGSALGTLAVSEGPNLTRTCTGNPDGMPVTSTMAVRLMTDPRTSPA